MKPEKLKPLVEKSPTQNKKLDFVLRQYEESDFSDYFRIHKESFKPYTDAHRGGWNDTFEYTKAKSKEEARLKFMKVITVNDEVAGFLDYHDEKDEEGTFIEFDYIATDSKFRGCGIATTLLNSMKKEADDRGLSIKLRVFKDNPVRQLYERNGFDYIKNDDGTLKELVDKNTGEKTHYYMERPARIMETEDSLEI